MSPFSRAIVTVPIVPWPHIGRHPDVSMKRIPTSQSGRVGGYRIEPDIISCPRGSNINPVRIQSYSARKCCRLSNIVSPLSCGMLPPATTLTGFPHVCPSMQKKVWRAIVALAVLDMLDGADGGGRQSAALQKDQAAVLS